MEESLLNSNNNERNIAEQQEHLHTLAELAAETGFIESPEMHNLRSDINAWLEKAREMIDDIAQQDSEVRKKLFIGCSLGLAGIYYEQRNKELYYETMEEACDAAYDHHFEDLRRKIIENG